MGATAAGGSACGMGGILGILMLVSVLSAKTTLDTDIGRGIDGTYPGRDMASRERALTYRAVNSARWLSMAQRYLAGAAALLLVNSALGFTLAVFYWRAGPKEAALRAAAESAKEAKQAAEEAIKKAEKATDTSNAALAAMGAEADTAEGSAVSEDGLDMI